MDRYRQMADRLDLDAAALEERASGYRMAGETEMTRMSASAARSVRMSAEWLRAMRDAEDQT